MGKWAPGHYDDVFSSKLKKIICRALDSSQSTTREDDDGVPVPIFPSSLSYEAFELACRRDSRNQSLDLTTPRMSAPSHRALTALLRAASPYPPPFPSSSYTSIWGHHDVTAEDEFNVTRGHRGDDMEPDFERYLYDADLPDNEGARVPHPPSGWRSRWGASPPPAQGDFLHPLPPRSPPLPPSAVSSFTRQRRPPVRARTAEFASYTSRRRSLDRLALANENERESDFIVGLELQPPHQSLSTSNSSRPLRRSYDPVRDAVAREGQSTGVPDEYSHLRFSSLYTMPNHGNAAGPSSAGSSSPGRTLLLTQPPSHSPPVQNSASNRHRDRVLRRGGLRAPELEHLSRRYSSPPRVIIHRSPSPMYPGMSLRDSNRRSMVGGGSSNPPSNEDQSLPPFV
ncbi:hypothetical protein BS47DRAFT_1342178, partial [Hydnum rufescens UP504]